MRTLHETSYCLRLVKSGSLFSRPITLSHVTFHTLTSAICPSSQMSCNCSMCSHSVHMDVKRSSDLNVAFSLAAAFLTLNTVVAILRMREDIQAVTFTISVYVFLMIFFWCLSVFDRLPQDSKEKERLKAPIWFLATSLNVMFAYRVWMIIQPSLALGWLVWGMSGTTSVITFYFFFVYGEKKTTWRIAIPSFCMPEKFRACFGSF